MVKGSFLIFLLESVAMMYEDVGVRGSERDGEADESWALLASKTNLLFYFYPFFV